ncbi:type II secretion system protein [Halalkalibacter sp. APA_J-10(15)]|uniref:type II secretion system protein n=1 Tax=Halalkalibacter sp. APA_J-10(15) TaxID=2933805 RepID=UPI001FF27E77|nr:type II secretion system protein [Halalkalibacter sp. APA_J-10(15)]MCK0472590.1 type II secretion system GspH family protein [Halalkalibacter sp. APA_J-10(15)]
MLSNKGLTLVEVMFALSCLMIIVMSLLPIIVIVQQELSANKQEREVLFLLEESMHYYRVSGLMNEPVVNEDILFTYEFIDNHIVRFCASWIALNGRDYEHCFVATH